MNGWLGTSSWDSIGQPPYRKLNEVTQPSDAFIFIEEADARNSSSIILYNLGTWVLEVSPPGWADTFAVFHGNVSTFAFADGHAEIHKWLIASTLKAARDSARGINSFSWAGGNGKNPDFRWVYDHYKHAKWAPLP